MTIRVTGADGVYIHLSGARLEDGADAQAITVLEAAELARGLFAQIAQMDPPRALILLGEMAHDRPEIAVLEHMRETP